MYETKRRILAPGDKETLGQAPHHHSSDELTLNDSMSQNETMTSLRLHHL